MWRRVGGEMSATHTHRATTEMGAAATHTHGAAAKVSSTSAAAEMSATTAATAEVSTTATATDVTTATAAEAAASGVSVRRQTQGKAYCGRACRDFPHDMTSSSGPNSSGPNV
jgi:hypothetical protein